MFAEILSTKPHNLHYLQKYINFIQACVNQPLPDYHEDHHICPKSDDLFPDFKSFKKFPWNKISLSLRQHYVAHFMLWKAYGGKQSQAFKLMCERAGKKNSRYYAVVRQQHIELMRNHNHNADGKQAKRGWATASDERRENQAKIMREVNKSKKKPKEERHYKCTTCSTELTREEFCHHPAKENYYCNASCRTIHAVKNRPSQLGISKPYKPGRVNPNKGKKGFMFGNSTLASLPNAMKDPDNVKRVIESRRRNGPWKSGFTDPLLTNPMRNPESIKRMIASRKRNKELRAEALNKGVSGYKELPDLG